MIEAILFILAILTLGIIYLRRYQLSEKISLFGRMVMKKGHSAPKPISEEDHEVTVKEMIPPIESVDPKLVAKGINYFKKAELALKRGDLEEAEKLYIQSISMNPANIESYAKLGSLYLNEESFSKAELIYRKLIIALPTNPSFFSNLGLSLFQQDKIAEAKKFYESALELDNKRPGRYYSLSRVNYELGDFDNAILNIQKAISMDEYNVDYALTLAHWYIEKEMNRNAQQVLENILKYFPESTEAQEMLSDITKTQGGGEAKENSDLAHAQEIEKKTD